MEEKTDNLILFDEESVKNTDNLLSFYSEPPAKDRKIDLEEDEPEEETEDDNTNVDLTRNSGTSGAKGKGKPAPTETEEEDNEEITEHKNRYKQLTDIGALYLPEDYEVPTTEESWEKALKDSDEFRKKDAVAAIWEQLPEEGRPLLEYLLAGGKDIDKFKQVYNSQFDVNKIDITNEEHQKQVLQTYYEKKGFNPEKAKKQVEIVENLMELETEALDAFEELKVTDTQEKQKLLKEAADTKAQREAKETQKWNLLQTTLEKTEDFGGGYVIGKKAKPKALESLYKQVKLDDGSVTTDFNYRLRHVVLQDPKLTLVLSDLLNKLKQDNKTNEFYFDLSNIKSAEETKITKSLKDKLDTLAQTGSKFKGGSAMEDKTKSNFWDRVL
jgi:hypothetical protein